MTFVLGGTEYTLTAEHYVRKVGNVGHFVLIPNFWFIYKYTDTDRLSLSIVSRRCSETRSCVSVVSRPWTLFPLKGPCGFWEMYF